MPKTPTSIMVISILGIIYGGLGVFGGPCSLLIIFLPLTPNSPLDPLYHDTGYRVFVSISTGLYFIFSVLLFSASIASLKLAKWGRAGMLTYAMVHPVVAILINVINFIYVIPKISALMAAAPATPGVPRMPMGLLGGVSAVLGVFVTLCISGVIGYFFTRPRAIDAFRGIFPADPGNFAVDSPRSNPPGPGA